MQSGPLLHFNAENYGVTASDGTPVGPSNQKHDSVKVTEFNVTGNVARLTFQSGLTLSKVLFRAIYKVGFELLCLQEGYDKVIDPRYDPLRDYIRYGRGRRALIFGSCNAASLHEGLYLKMDSMPGTPDWVATIIMGMTIYVDLSPDHLLGATNETELLKAGFTQIYDDQLKPAAGSN
jgi:hypothetical protein